MKKLRIGMLDYSGVVREQSALIPKMQRGVMILRNAIRRAGHIPVTYKVENCQMYFNGRNSEILYKNKKIRRCDVLFSRVALADNIDLEISVVKQFQMMNIPVVNEYLPVTRAKNKLRTLQIFSKNNVPVPRTIVVRKFEYMDEAIKQISGYPVILKTPFGSLGSGVVLVESRRSLYSALDIIWKRMSTNILLIQEYIEEAGGSDIRAFVIDDKVVAAMKRTAKTGDFRSNLFLGGEGQKVQLTEEEKKLAVKATQVIGLKIAGVDILRSKKGPLVMEVNANPGMNITLVTGVDVPMEMVKFAVSYAKKKAKVKQNAS